jgi:hypothetical protein
VIAVLEDVMRLSAASVTVQEHSHFCLNMARASKHSLKRLADPRYAASPSLAGLQRHLHSRLESLDQVPSGEQISHVTMFARRLKRSRREQ